MCVVEEAVLAAFAGWVFLEGMWVDAAEGFFGFGGCGFSEDVVP